MYLYISQLHNIVEMVVENSIRTTSDSSSIVVKYERW